MYADLIPFQLCEFRYLKANYESCVDWRTAIDYLRCNPSFHGQLRRDFVIIQKNEDEIFFAQILFIFQLTVADTQHSLALIQPYTEPIPPRSRPKKDRELGLLRVRTGPPGSSEFVFLESIVRGALLVDARDHDSDKLVVDILDTDMFLRLRSLHRY